MVMRLNMFLPLLLIGMLFSCKVPKDNNVVNNSTNKYPIKATIKKKAADEVVIVDKISKSACRVQGVIIGETSTDKDIILKVTSFLGEGASFNTYRPRSGEKIEVKGLRANNYSKSDTIKIEIQTLPIKPNEDIQKVGLIKILDL